MGRLGPGLLILPSYFLVSLKSLHCPCRCCRLSRLSFLGQSSKLADMLFQGSHSCYEFCGRFTDSFCRYLILLLIPLPAFLAVNPDYLPYFSTSPCLSSHAAAAPAHLALNSLPSLLVQLAFAFRCHSRYVYLFIGGHMQAFLIFSI